MQLNRLNESIRTSTASRIELMKSTRKDELLETDQFDMIIREESRIDKKLVVTKKEDMNMMKKNK